MPESTPPPDPFDHKPAHDWADGMMGRIFRMAGPLPDNIRWALVEAYMAGRAETLEGLEPWKRGTVIPWIGDVS